MVLENHAGQFFLWQQMRKNNHTKSRPPAKPNLIKISNNPDRSIGGLDYFCKKIKKHLTI